MPDVQKAAGGVSFDAPEGTVTINAENNHITKTARIGEIRKDGLIYTVWDFRQADRAGSLPQGLRLGQGPGITRKHL